jgi:hypothetical protein
LTRTYKTWQSNTIHGEAIYNTTTNVIVEDAEKNVLGKMWEIFGYVSSFRKNQLK